MLVLTVVALATVKELFQYKSQQFRLEDFPGYTPDQWGIKAHNRPWIEEVGNFSKGQRIIEVGGAYSLLPKYLAEKYQLEAWIGDDFGIKSGQTEWARWEDPFSLPQKYPSIKYIFERFGEFSSSYPNEYFDRIFSVSTLEHVPVDKRLSVIRDMHRCLRPGGRQLHTIDIPISSPRSIVIAALRDKMVDKFSHLDRFARRYSSPVRNWIRTFEASGVVVSVSIPNPIQLLDRRILVESPDVVYRFYPPNNQPKRYSPCGSLLIIIDDLKPS